MMSELADTSRLAVSADRTNLYLVERGGVLSLHSEQGQGTQFLIGEQGDRHGCIFFHKHLRAESL